MFSVVLYRRAVDAGISIRIICARSILLSTEREKGGQRRPLVRATLLFARILIVLWCYFLFLAVDEHMYSSLSVYPQKGEMALPRCAAIFVADRTREAKGTVFLPLCVRRIFLVLHSYRGCGILCLYPKKDYCLFERWRYFSCGSENSRIFPRVHARTSMYIYIAIFLILHQKIVCSHPLSLSLSRAGKSSISRRSASFLFQNLVVLLIPVYKCAPLKSDPDHRRRTGKPP